MAAFSEYVRKRLGWCPNAGAAAPCRRVDTEFDQSARKERPPVAGPESDGTVGGDRSGYQENMLLILLALAWLFPIVYQREFLPILVVLCAVALYVDAQNIRAGEGFLKETLLGNIVTWRPLTWGLAAFVGGIVIMAIYLFHRREIYTTNRGGIIHEC